MRRKDRQVTDPVQIASILTRAKVCHIGISDQDAPYVVPLNFGYELQDDVLTLYFHSAHEGRKIDLIQKNPSAGFAIDLANGLIEAQSPCAYGYRYESIIGEGVCTLVDDVEEKKLALRAIMRQQTQSDVSFSDEQAKSCAVFKIVSTRFSAKACL